jgi:hypothetical protein
LTALPDEGITEKPIDLISFDKRVFDLANSYKTRLELGKPEEDISEFVLQSIGGLLSFLDPLSVLAVDGEHIVEGQGLFTLDSVDDV